MLINQNRRSNTLRPSSENCKSTTEYDNSESSKTSLDSEIEDSKKLEEIDFNVKDVHYKSNVESNKSYFTEVSYGGGTVLSSTPINKNLEEWPGLIKENLDISFFPKAPALFDLKKPIDASSKKRSRELTDTSDKSIQELVGDQIKKIKNKAKFKKTKNDNIDKLLDIPHEDIGMFEKNNTLSNPGVTVSRKYVDANGITCESGTIDLEAGIADVSHELK